MALAPWLTCAGQDPSTPPIRQVVHPPAPNAASLGRFGAIPVNNYTGLPKVDIPLYTLQQGTITLPIALSYHAAVKVNDVAPWVGLEWALSAGGVITHTVKGLDDRHSQGYWQQKAAIDAHTNFTEGYLRLVNNGLVDTQPDSYFYSVGGSSGAMLFSDPTHAFAVTERGLSITYVNQGYVLVDKEGTSYLFGTTAASRDDTFGSTDGDQATPPNYASTCHLDAIISANKADTVRLAYTPEYIEHTGQANETDYLPSNPLVNNPILQKNTVTASEQTTQRRLQTIQWRNGLIRFGSATARRDLSGSTALDYVEVCDRFGRVIKRYDFVYDYFYTNSSLTDTHPIAGHAYAEEEVRLKLLRVNESGGTEHTPGYQFRYYEHLGIPARNSCAQDHWGFANLNSVPTLLPAISQTGNGVVGYPGGGSREPDFRSALAGLLREVRYPTGGATRLYYEAHDVGQEATQNATITTTRRKVMNIRGADVDANGVINKQDTLQVPRSAQVVIGCSASLGNVPNAEGEFSVGFRSSAGILVGCQAVTPTPRPGSPPPATKTCSSTLNTNLYPSTYMLYAMGSIEAGTTVSGTVTATLTESTPVSSTTLNTVVVGGARLQRMVDVVSTAGDSLVSTYAYTVQKSGTTVSSGVLVTKPTYTFGYAVIDAIPTGGFTYTIETHSYTGIASSPHSGLGFTQGSHLGYKQVTVTHLKGGIANGSTVYNYTSAADFPDHVTALLALEPATSSDYQRGLLTRQQTFDARGYLLERVRNQYISDPRTYHEIRGLAVRAVRSVHPQLQSQYPTYASGFYRLHEHWQYLKRTTTTRFASADTAVQQTQQRTYFYGNPSHGLVTQVTTADPATGEQRMQCLRYPLDYVLNGTDAHSLGVAGLQQAHQLTPVLEEAQWLKRPGGTDSLLQHSVAHTYRQRPSGRSVEDEVYQLDLTAPTSSYVAPNSTAAGWQQDARYRLLQTYEVYDRTDNPVQITRRADRPSSYLWSDTQGKLLAEARNASSAQIAYTSFEPDATGGWQYDSLGTRQVATPFAGAVAYELDGTPASAIRRPGLPAGEYELWFWSHGANVPLVSMAYNPVLQRDEVMRVIGPWHQHRVRFSLPPNATVQVNSAPNQLIWIDELRLHPVGAQMTSYTHQPLVGLTSQTDPAGRTTRYEYDGLGRLVRVRDEQGRVLTEQQYHYARP